MTGFTKYIVFFFSWPPHPLIPPSPPSSLSEATAHLFHRLGWQDVPLLHPIERVEIGGVSRPLTVKSATSLLTLPYRIKRNEAHALYAERAVANDLLPFGSEITRLQPFLKALQLVWKTPWLNVHKEPLWRLAINGIPGRHLHHDCPCSQHKPCSFPSDKRSIAWRDHHFWSCPLPQSLFSVISQSLSFPIQCHHVWLLHTPHHTMHRGAWSIMATAAIAALDSARRYLIKCHLEDHDQDDGQTLITDFFTPTSSPSSPARTCRSPLERAQRFAVERFWALLQDFADLHPTIPSTWTNVQLLRGHPIFSSPDGSSLVFKPP